MSHDFNPAKYTPRYNTTFTTVLTDDSSLALANAVTMLLHSKTVDLVPTADGIDHQMMQSNLNATTTTATQTMLLNTTPSSVAQSSDVDITPPRILRRDTQSQTNQHESTIDINVQKKRSAAKAKVSQTSYDVDTTAHVEAKARDNKAHAIFHAEGDRLEKATRVLEDFSFKSGDSNYVDPRIRYAAADDKHRHKQHNPDPTRAQCRWQRGEAWALDGAYAQHISDWGSFTHITCIIDIIAKCSLVYCTRTTNATEFLRCLNG